MVACSSSSAHVAGSFNTRVSHRSRAGGGLDSGMKIKRGAVTNGSVCVEREARCLVVDVGLVLLLLLAAVS